MIDTSCKSSQEFKLNKNHLLLATFFVAFSTNATSNSDFKNGTKGLSNYKVTLNCSGESYPMQNLKAITYKRKRNFRELYGRISKSEWFKNAYENKSLGDRILIEES